MKILITPATLEISDNHSYSKGAIANIAYNLLRSLSKYEIELYVLSKGLDITRNLPNNLKLFNLTNSRIKNSHYIHTKAFFCSIKLSKAILKTQNISVISQMYLPYGVGFNPLFKAIRDYPFVIGMCELPHPLLDDEIDKTKKYIANIGKKFLFSLFRKTLDYCDMLIAVNEATKDLYSNLMPRKKIKVIPYGVDLERFKYSPLPFNHDILAVSRLIKRRNLNYLVEAMPLILKEYPDAKLHFVGSGPRKEILQRKAKELGISSKVIFHGNVSASELVNLYRDCYIFCHLSFADGWNQPALEAMASGRPVVCTDAPHNSMVVNNKTGFLIPYGDVNELAEKIMKLFSDRGMGEKMGIEGRRKVEEEYDWNMIAEKYYKVYKKVSEGGS
ncbi:MAG: hypothetical protein DRP18_00210 [Candidatus Aenigmatarchaeota archaeon]|nr:MAG: hypothetical protein DRP18_00210 [Candidatus Aenigmarchaeota archaeon]